MQLAGPKKDNGDRNGRHVMELPDNQSALMAADRRLLWRAALFL